MSSIAILVAIVYMSISFYTFLYVDESKPYSTTFCHILREMNIDQSQLFEGSFADLLLCLHFCSTRTTILTQSSRPNDILVEATTKKYYLFNPSLQPSEKMWNGVHHKHSPSLHRISHGQSRAFDKGRDCFLQAQGNKHPAISGHSDWDNCDIYIYIHISYNIK